MDINVQNEVILPLVLVDGVLIVYVSTPRGRLNYFSQFADLIDPETGDYVFERIVVVSMCQECMDKDADFCPHLGPSDIPDWRSSSTMRARHVNLMYIDDDERRMQETQGRVIESEKGVFSVRTLKTVFSEARIISIRKFVHNEPPRYVVVTCDPSGGGESEFALCATFRDTSSGRIVVRACVCGWCAHAR